MQFNPNKPAKTKQFFWATYIPYRQPEFKMHSNRGHALNAFKYKNDAILYKWNPEKEEWIEIYRMENWRTNEHPNCEGCGKQTLDPTVRYAYNSGDRVWINKDDDMKLKQIWVCYDCERQLRR